ncbi:hypothetical protein [uncultured Chryseobacterium sp.]|uniref:hypothetical protein n=1 Tax=uncultured Chryseobacterium sp. TaxID=259322 RepID=UPI0025FD8743|nr:hypothetical protein [uncultured Chryseobacterium sp.]
MKKCRVFFMLLVMLCVQQLQAQDPVLKPEKVFQLYFNAYVRYDNPSLDELNAYNSRFLDTESIRDQTFSDKVDHLTEIFLSTLPGQVAEACRPDARNYFTVLMDQLKNADYQIKSISDIDDKQLAGKKITEIMYQVHVKVPSKTLGMKGKDISKLSIAEMKEYLKNLTSHFKKADKQVEISNTFRLYQKYKDGDLYYWNGGPESLSWNLEEAYFKNIN